MAVIMRISCRASIAVRDRPMFTVPQQGAARKYEEFS
jgi:hypothetical protein